MATTLTKLANPTTLPSATGYSCVFSPNGSYFAMGLSNGACFYTVSGETFTYAGSTSTSKYPLFYSDNIVLLPVSSTSTTLATFHQYATGSPFTLIGISSITAGYAGSPASSAIARSGNSSFWVGRNNSWGSTSKRTIQQCTVSTSTSPVTITESYYAYNNISSMQVAVFSSTLAAYTGSANVELYRSGVISSSIGISNASGLAFNHNGTELAVVVSAYLYRYTNLSGTPTLLDTTAGGAGTCCAYSPNGKYLAKGLSSSPYIRVYEIDSENNLTALSNPDIYPAGRVRGCIFSPNGKLLVCVHDNSPYLTVYSITDNVAPTIDDLTTDIDSTHNNSVTLSFILSDSDVDQTLSYQISINGVAYQAYTEYTEPVSLVIPADAFSIGTNAIKVEATDGYLTVNETVYIVRTNAAPVLTGTLDKQVLTAVLGDADGDVVSWMATLNGAELFAWSDFAAPPVNIDFTLSAGQVNIGVANTLSISFKDSAGSAATADFDFVGVNYSRKSGLFPYII